MAKPANKTNLLAPPLVARSALAGKGGQEGEVQALRLGQLGHALLQQVSPPHQLIQAAQTQAGQADAHLLCHKSKVVHLQGKGHGVVAAIEQQARCRI